MTCVCVCASATEDSHSVAWRVSASATEDSHSVACSSWHERYCPTHPTPPHPHPKRHRLHFHFCSSWHEPYCPTHPTPSPPQMTETRIVLQVSSYVNGSSNPQTGFLHLYKFWGHERKIKAHFSLIFYWLPLWGEHFLTLLDPEAVFAHSTPSSSFMFVCK